MSNNQKDIDQLFKQKLENFALPSQGASWNMLQLAKLRHVRMRNIFFAKMLVGATIVLSTTVVLIFSNKSVDEETLIKSEHTIEMTDNTGDLTKEDHTSKEELTTSKINKTANQKTSAINTGIPSLLPIDNQVSHDHSEADDPSVDTQFELNIREAKQLLISESSTTY